MSGAIMPLPLAIAAMRTVSPSIRASPPAPLENVSVVRMASAAARHFAGEGGASSSAARATAIRIAAAESGSPMTPVEAR